MGNANAVFRDQIAGRSEFGPLNVDKLYTFSSTMQL